MQLIHPSKGWWRPPSRVSLTGTGQASRQHILYRIHPSFTTTFLTIKSLIFLRGTTQCSERNCRDFLYIDPSNGARKFLPYGEGQQRGPSGALLRRRGEAFRSLVHSKRWRHSPLRSSQSPQVSQSSVFSFTVVHTTFYLGDRASGLVLPESKFYE